ncbi:MAG TPA: serine/threonine-protein kinase [Actinocrinis sp.]|uniref:serine/threonine-protein kinase n=1 Tax=Actinocrinis sp. TaxID=1920516 RepID=UPI002DDC9471|nr:serine/threonine-protein kinase [Actinocrinis sp.]HEV3170932.1 serine/threonine-protein kinase [Actinocrinis sp.]
MTQDDDLIAGRYRLITEIGSGGMGVVWRAKDETLGRTVAVKSLAAGSIAGTADEDAARRAMREARIAARLHHPNVIGVYDVVEHEGRPFLVMEYMDSRSLSEMLAAGDLLDPREAGRIGAHVASALTAAHNAGIVHRDVKPGNVLVAKSGDVKLTDFGISRAVGDTSVTASGVLLGTISYIAPEVAQGQSADSRSDVYSLGATLYALLEGEPPSGTDESAIAQLYRIVHGDIPAPAHAGPLAPILLWMLERDPALRPTPVQVERALESIESTQGAAGTAAIPVEEAVALPEAADPPAAPPPVAVAEAPPSRTPFSPTARRSLVVSLLAALLLVGVVVALLLHGNGHPTASGSGAPAGHSATETPSPKASHTTAAAGAGIGAGATAGQSPSSAASAPAAPPSASASQSLADQLTSTIVDYYKLMPDNLDQGWNWMTADYQQNHAGGRNGYQSFWSKVQRVSVSDVVAQPPSTVVATIDYFYKDGSTAEERTSFGLVFQQGQWKIASSAVLGQ